MVQLVSFLFFTFAFFFVIEFVRAMMYRVRWEVSKTLLFSMGLSLITIGILVSLAPFLTEKFVLFFLERLSS